MIAYTFYETDNRVRRYAEALAQRGDHVDVIALLNPLASEESNLFKFEIINGVNIFRIQKRKINEKWKFSYLFRVVSFLINSSLFLIFKNIKNHYQLIHVHSIPDFEVFAALIPKLMGSKIILDIHDIVPEFYASKFNVKENSFIFKSLIFAEKISIAFSDHLIIANHIWQKKLLSRSVENDKCSVYLNYPDQNIFFQRKRTRDHQKLILIYPGTLNWHQGIDIAIKAIAEIVKTFSNIEFYIYGDGPEKLKILELANELGISSHIYMKQVLPLEGIADAISNADIGIVPKRKDSFGNEAFSTKIFEFMSLGIPVIASNTKIDKFYFDDSTILFFESGNHIDLSQKIISLITNLELRKRFSASGLQCIEENSWEIHKLRYFQLVDSLINNIKCDLL